MLWFGWRRLMLFACSSLNVRTERKQSKAPEAQASVYFFFCSLCLMFMQTKNVTLLYLLVIFVAISAQMIIVSMAHILLPKVHLWIYACGWYIRPFELAAVKSNLVCFFLELLSVFFAAFTACACQKHSLSEEMKDKNRKAYFQSWILGERKTRVYTCLACKTVALI